MKKKIKTGLIGLGYAGVKRYIPIMKSMPEYDLTGVIDTDMEKARAVSREHGIAYFSSSGDYNDADWFKELDAVIIATPPFSHHKYITESLAAGKHVLVDKPFVMTLAEADDVLSLAKKQDKKLAVIHNSQFSETFRRLLSDIEDKKLGAVKAITCSLLNNPKRQVPAWHHELPWGQFFDESPHSFYMIKRLAGDRLKYAGTLAYPNSDKNRKTPSSVFINYATWDNTGFQIPVQLYFNFEAPVSEWHLKVIGDKGIGIVDYFRDIYIYLPNDGQHKMKNVLKTSFFATGQHWLRQIKPALKYLSGTWISGHDTVFKLFAAGVINGNDMSYIDGSYGREIVRMQHEAMKLQP